MKAIQGGFRIEFGLRSFYLLADSKEEAKKEAMRRILADLSPFLSSSPKAPQERLVWNGMTIVNFELIDIRKKGGAK